MSDSVEQVIYDYLTSDSTFMANFTGVYWIDAPKDTASPYIVFWEVDNPNDETLLNKCDQGNSRIQCNLWDLNKNRGRRLRTVLRTKMLKLDQTNGGYYVRTDSVNSVTNQRPSGTALYQFIVDSVINWHKV